LFDQNRYHPKRLPCHCYLAPYKTIPQPQPYSKHAEVTVPSLDDWEKEWGGNSQRSVQPKLLPVDFRSPLAAIAQSN
jgi:hypothetical protein